MTRHPTARRVHRKASNPDDAFVAGVLESSAWAKEHSRKIIIGSAIAAALIIIAVLWSLNRAAKEKRAAQEIIVARAGMLTGNPQVAIPQLEEFVRSYGGTRPAGEARMMLAQAYLQTGQVPRAIEIATPVANDLDSEFGPNAAFLLSGAYETGQQPDRAEEVLLRIAEDAPFAFHRQDALDNVARIRIQRGDYAGAAEIYQRLIDAAPPESSERQVFQLRLGEVQAAAASGAAAPAAATTTPAGDTPAQPAAAPGGTAPADTTATTGG